MKINSSIKQGGLRVKTLTAIVALGFILTGCATEETIDCEISLDNREFTTVSENSSCSDYQRASAYLGRAGFLFENFLADGASDNNRKALGIPDSATSYDSWDGKTYYDAALQLSGESAGDEYEGLDRSNALIEIHYFASLAAMMGRTYIELDSDANGTISEAEKNAFSKVNSKDSSDYGSNDIQVTQYLQLSYSDGKVALIDTQTPTNCIVETGTSEGVGFLNNGTSVTTGSGTCAFTTTSTGASCAIVFKVESMTKLFTEKITASGGSITGLTGGFVTGLANIDTDLAALGIPDDSDLRKSLDDFKTKLDNGGSCTSDSITAVDKLLNLIAVSQEVSTSDYGDLNVISLTSLVTSSDSTQTTAPEVPAGLACTNASSLDARLVFKHPNGTYYPYYKPTSTTDQASSGTYVSFVSLTNIQKNSDGNTIADTKGDDLVSFKELLCMQ